MSLANAICNDVIYVRAGLDALLSHRSGSLERHLIPMQLVMYDHIALVLNVLYVDTSRDSVAGSLRKILSLVGVGNG